MVLLCTDIATAFFIVALIATCYRCVSRYRLGFWWHDDSVALFSALSFIMFVVGSYNIYFCRAPDLGTNDSSFVTLGFTLFADGMDLHS